MSDNPVISVVIPMYNGADHIKKCLDLLDEQTYSGKYEILIVDDCSTDESVYDIRQYFEKLKKKDWFRMIECNKNGRAGKARNIGVKEAKGEYVVFIDQDDYPSKLFLERLYLLTNNGKYDMTSCDIMDRSGEEYHRCYIGEKKSLDDYDKRRLMKNFGYCFANLIRRDILINNCIMFSENVLFEDCLYNYGVIACLDSFNSTDEVLYFRVSDPESQTAFFTKKKLYDRIESTLQYLVHFSHSKRIMGFQREIQSEAFYYVYLSCTLWLMAIPGLYDRALFTFILNNGRKLNPGWDSANLKGDKMMKQYIPLLRLVYSFPLMIHPLRFLGTSLYKIRKRLL